MQDKMPENVFSIGYQEQANQIRLLRDQIKTRYPDIFKDEGSYISLDFSGFPPLSESEDILPYRINYSNDIPEYIKSEFEASLPKDRRK